MTAVENDLVEQLKAGDARAWRLVLDGHVPQLLGYATRLLGDRAAAEEAVQEAVVSVYGAIQRFEGRVSVKSWLYRAVHNRAIDELRRRTRYVSAPEGDDGEAFAANGRWLAPPSTWEGSVGARIDARRLADVVERALAGLPHDHREVLLLKEVHGLSTPEICDALGISAGNLRVRLHRARRALRDAVDGEIVET